MVGVIIAQLTRLQHSLHPNPVIGFFVVSVPLSCVCHASAVLISAFGAIRFLRLQKEMARGYAIAGGWELKCVGTLTTLVSNATLLTSSASNAADLVQVIVCIFSLALAITIEKG
jgi:hypothetical protein